jgi:ribonuclease P protein component
MRARGERRARRQRLSRSGDFERIYRDGRSHASRYLVLYTFPRGSGDEPRLGLSVGRKIGGAVDRNRVKRVLREAFWARAEALPADHDFVIVARPDSRELVEDGAVARLTTDLDELIGRAASSERAAA